MSVSLFQQDIQHFIKNRNLPGFKWINFPEHHLADEQGLIGYGGKINLSYLVSAYLQGVFPWPNSEVPVPLWYSPNPRGIIDFKKFCIPKSFKKFQKKSPFRISFNTCFETVMRECQEAHKEDGIWITEEMIKGYKDLFIHELAYSVECWDIESHELVGGLYGVCLGSFFSAESMFHKASNASKTALCGLSEVLIRKFQENQREGWLDTQMITPVVESFGGEYIDREEFLKKLYKCDLSLNRSQFFP
jgi:leucyl/phenylalanyl-tRNA--protein transferase